MRIAQAVQHRKASGRMVSGIPSGIRKPINKHIRQQTRPTQYVQMTASNGVAVTSKVVSLGVVRVTPSNKRHGNSNTLINRSPMHRRVSQISGNNSGQIGKGRIDTVTMDNRMARQAIHKLPRNPQFSLIHSLTPPRNSQVSLQAGKGMATMVNADKLVPIHHQQPHRPQ